MKATLAIPGYPDATAKLVISRSAAPFKREPGPYRKGGILIKSRHAVHEATLFDPGLEPDVHAERLYGKLTCPYIDDLWNAFDDRAERHEDHDPRNPVPIIDPARRQGLTKDHPFVKALFGEALKHLRPLVEEERRQAEGTRAAVETRRTRQRLNKLQDAAAKFMEERQDDTDPARDPTTRQATSQLRENGYVLSPPFVQLVVGRSQKVRLTVRLESFPELSVGSDVQIQCLTDEVSCDRSLVSLSSDPMDEGLLQAIWTMTAERPTPATLVRVRCGPIVADTAIEVFESDRDRYRDVRELMFRRKRYLISADGTTRKTVTLLAPIDAVPATAHVDIVCSDPAISIGGSLLMYPRSALGISEAKFTVRCSKEDAEGTIEARVLGLEARAIVQGVPPKGSTISVKLEDIDLGSQRYRWKGNVLEIAVRHPAVRRYLGPPPSPGQAQEQGFAGQDQKHFRVLLAEIVTDAVCSRIIERREMSGAYEDDETDFQFFSAELYRLASQFAPLAHSLVLPDSEAR